MNTLKSIDLFCQSGSSDKEYHLQIVEAKGGYVVNFQYGRRGSTLKGGSKTPSPVPLEKAHKIYDKVVSEKTGEVPPYITGDSAPTDYVSVAPSAKGPDTTTEGPRRVNWKSPIFIPQLLNPIDEDDIESYLRDDRYGAQEKKDGEHQPVHKSSGRVIVTNKKGQPIGYPAALETALKDPKDTIVDAESIGGVYHAFDLLEAMGEDLRGLGYLDRYEVLAKMFKEGLFDTQSIVLVPLAIGYKAKKALFDSLKKKEGIVFKKLDAPYTPGKAHEDMWKAKFYHELSARVAKSREGKRSVGLELLDGDKWVKVGNCTIPVNREIPAVGSILEVRYLYAYKGGSLYQTTYEKPRIDVDAEECTVAQIHYKHEED